jgi:hypothetical protein
VNKFLLPLFVAALLPVVGAQETMPYHPYRKVEDRYYSVQPIYDWMQYRKWIRNRPSGEMKRLIESGTTQIRPMPDWIGAPMYLSEGEFGAKIVQVLPDGLLMTFGGNANRMFFLTNYPFHSQVVDGQHIDFLAIKTGIYRYAGVGDVPHSVEMYDYGIPYDPRALATNQPPFVNKSVNSSGRTNLPSKR